MAQRVRHRPDFLIKSCRIRSRLIAWIGVQYRLPPVTRHPSVHLVAENEQVVSQLLE
jgi:hypothetical protein